MIPLICDKCKENKHDECEYPEFPCECICCDGIIDDVNGERPDREDDERIN
jgi:hypothetical protein